MIVSTVVTGVLVALAAGYLVRKAVIISRGRMVFQYPSGRAVPESFDPLTWRALRG